MCEKVVDEKPQEVCQEVPRVSCHHVQVQVQVQEQER